MAPAPTKSSGGAPDAAAKRARRAWLGKRVNLNVRNPRPLENAGEFWRGAAQAATIVMSVLAFGGVVYLTRSILVPVLSAVVVGMTFGPVIDYAGKRRIPAWAMALLIVVLLVVALNVAIITLAKPMSEMVGRAPELGSALRDKLHFFDRPMAAMHELQTALGFDPAASSFDMNAARLLEGAVTIITPAALQFATQSMLFVGTLIFFIIGRASFRKFLVKWFSSRSGKLRALKILNDIEENLSGYLVVVTIINLALGLVTILAAYLMGLPAPVLWGALAFGLNYVPYVGPAIMDVCLFVVGILTFPTLLGALLPPGVFLAITIVEGQFLTPAIVGHRVLNMQPLAIFLSIAFWAWMWGPIGAFLATPILIVFRVVLDHIYPHREVSLPG
jgi:predicted PurR-regulated permease PerM